MYKHLHLDFLLGLPKSILDYLRKTYESRISYPYMVCDKKNIVVGYNPGEYEELMKGGAA